MLSLRYPNCATGPAGQFVVYLFDGSISFGDSDSAAGIKNGRSFMYTVPNSKKGAYSVVGPTLQAVTVPNNPVASAGLELMLFFVAPVSTGTLHPFALESFSMLRAAICKTSLATSLQPCRQSGSKSTLTPTVMSNSFAIKKSLTAQSQTPTVKD
jgi:hypothetical protein